MFIGITLENTGVLIPREPIMIVGGVLSGRGELNYWGVVVTATAEAVIGDNFRYWIGRSGS